MRMSRFSLGVRRKDAIRNEHVRSVLKADRFGPKVRQSRLILYGHMKRHDEDYVGIKMSEKQWSGKRRRGRQQQMSLEVV